MKQQQSPDSRSIVMPEASMSTCRICYSNTSSTWYNSLWSRLVSLPSSLDSKHLIRPCLQCKGSIGAVHMKCLEKWLAISKSDKCDVCKSKLIIEKYPKHFTDWIKECDKSVKCYILTDVLSFFFLTPITLVSIYLCVRGLILHASSTYEVLILLLLILLVLIPYFAWLITCLYQHYQCASDWCRSNFTFRTQLPSTHVHSTDLLPHYKLTSESSSVTGGNSRRNDLSVTCDTCNHHHHHLSDRLNESTTSHTAPTTATSNTHHFVQSTDSSHLQVLIV